MTTTSKAAAAAQALQSARDLRQPIPPISVTWGIEGLEAAYEVATINTRLRVEKGNRIIGKKIGLTSKAVQQQLGVNQPDFGMLFDDMEILNGESVETARLMQPKIEAEVAFVIGKDLEGTQPSWAQFLNSIAYALPALEIVDSAIADWKISLVDTVADNASCGLFVLGDQPVALGHISLADLGMQMSINGQAASVGTGAACMGHPLRAAYWLATTMARRSEGLRAGEIIMSGALGPMVPVRAGDSVHAHLGALGQVSCRMV